MSKDYVTYIETNRLLSFLKNFKKKLFSYFKLKEFHITLYLQGTIILRHVYHNIHFLKDFFLLKGMVLGMLNKVHHPDSNPHRVGTYLSLWLGRCGMSWWDTSMRSYANNSKYANEWYVMVSCPLRFCSL